MWLCPHCERALHGAPPLPARHSSDPLSYLPLVRVAAAALVLVSAILAAGAHW